MALELTAAVEAVAKVCPIAHLPAANLATLTDHGEREQLRIGQSRRDRNLFRCHTLPARRNYL